MGWGGVGDHAGRNPRRHVPRKAKKKTKSWCWDICTNRENFTFFQLCLHLVLVHPPPLSGLSKRGVWRSIFIFHSPGWGRVAYCRLNRLQKDNKEEEEEGDVRGGGGYCTLIAVLLVLRTVCAGGLTSKPFSVRRRPPRKRARAEG